MSENTTINRAVTRHKQSICELRTNIKNEVQLINQIQQRLNLEAEAYKNSLMRIHQEQKHIKANGRDRLNDALAANDSTRIALSTLLRKLNFHVATAHEITQKYQIKGEFTAECIEIIDKNTGEVITTSRPVGVLT